MCVREPWFLSRSPTFSSVVFILTIIIPEEHLEDDVILTDHGDLGCPSVVKKDWGP